MTNNGISQQWSSFLLSLSGTEALWHFRSTQVSVHSGGGPVSAPQVRWSPWIWRLGAKADKAALFRPSATKSGRPYGVTSALSLSSCRTPTTTTTTLLGWPPCHVMVSRDHMMVAMWCDGRGHSAFTLTKRTCLEMESLLDTPKRHRRRSNSYRCAWYSDWQLFSKIQTLEYLIALCRA